VITDRAEYARLSRTDPAPYATVPYAEYGAPPSALLLFCSGLVLQLSLVPRELLASSRFAFLNA
jgi:hypothetical protein